MPWHIATIHWWIRRGSPCFSTGSRWSRPDHCPPAWIRKTSAGRVAPKWRNQALAWFLSRLQLAQAEGQGIPTILRSMRQEGCPPPVFETSEARVVCTLPAHSRHTELLAAMARDRRKMRLLEVIAGRGAMGTPFENLSQALPEASRNDLRVLLRELRKAGHIHLRGTTKAARWFPGREDPEARS